MSSRPAAATFSALHTDNIGTVQRATNASKTIVWTGNYDPNGAVTPTTSIIMNLRQLGVLSDVSGDNHNGFRDRVQGTIPGYLQSDPLGIAPWLLSPSGPPNTYPWLGWNPYKNVDPLGLATLQIGFAGTVSLPFTPTFALGVGIAFDNHFNAGLYGYAGGGAQIGASGEAGLSIQISDARYITDLSGPFGNFSGHAGAGVGGSLDYFTGPSANGIVHGGGVTLGAALGASAFGGVTDTVIAPFQPNPIFAVQPPSASPADPCQAGPTLNY